MYKMIDFLQNCLNPVRLLSVSLTRTAGSNSCPYLSAHIHMHRSKLLLEDLCIRHGDAKFAINIIKNNFRSYLRIFLAEYILSKNTALT